jgi:hypothetical protein
MPAADVIHFALSAQLISPSFFLALRPPESVSESPPWQLTDCFCRARSEFRPSRYPCVSQHFYELPDRGFSAASNSGETNAKSTSVRGDSVSESGC